MVVTWWIVTFLPSVSHYMILIYSLCFKPIALTTCDLLNNTRHQAINASIINRLSEYIFYTLVHVYGSGLLDSGKQTVHWN